MSDTDPNRLVDPTLDADLARLGDPDKADPTPARLGAAPAPAAADDPDRPAAEPGREAVGEGAGSGGGVEGVDEDAARRDAVRDATN